MPRMPKRPRTHAQETESVRDFQALLPSNWIYRTPTDDYGIDGEVEVFDESGTATGKRFLVQLKATDQTNKKKSLKLRLPIEKGNYFDSLELPVLVVRYLAKSREIYIRWFHSFDPYFESKTENGFTMNYSDTDLWTENTPEALIASLDAFIQIRKRKNPFPLTMPICFTPDNFLGETMGELAMKIHKSCGSYSDLLSFNFTTFDDGLPPNFVLFDATKMQVVLADKTAACLHFEKGLAEEWLSQFVHNFYAALGMALVNCGFYVQAGKLLHNHILDSLLRDEVRMVSATIFTLTQTRKYKECVELVEKLIDNDIDAENVSAQIALVGAIRYFGRDLSGEFESIIETVERISEGLADAGQRQLAAVFEYNIANFSRQHANNPRQPLRHYRRAASYDPEYKTRAYWLAEVAGCLFLLGRFGFASTFYAKALTIDPRNRWRGLYADALMFAGEYAKAKKTFDEYFDADCPHEAEWKLKSLSLHAITGALGLDKQTRKSKEIPQQTLEGGDPDAIVQLLKEQDALNPRLWFALGLLEVAEESYDDAMACFLTSAFCDEGNLDAWANASNCAHKAGMADLSALILVCAHKKLGSSVIEHWMRAGFHHGEAMPLDAQLKMIEVIQAFETTNQRDDPLEVRLHNESGGYDKLITGDATSNTS